MYSKFWTMCLFEVILMNSFLNISVLDRIIYQVFFREHYKVNFKFLDVLSKFYRNPNPSLRMLFNTINGFKKNS